MKAAAMYMPVPGEGQLSALHGQHYYERLHRYVLAFSLASERDVLDVAAGDGYGAAYLAIAARSVVAVDPDPELTLRAGATYTAMNLSFRAGELERLPLADASADLVVSFETIERVAGAERFVRELRRVLRADGVLLISARNQALSASHLDDGAARGLYFDEFRELLREAFPHVRIYGQRIVGASAVHPLRGVARDAQCVGPSARADEQGLPALSEPSSFIAACSPVELRELILMESLFVDPRADLAVYDGEERVTPSLRMPAARASLGARRAALPLASDGWEDAAFVPASEREAEAAAVPDALPARAAQLETLIEDVQAHAAADQHAADEEALGMLDALVDARRSAAVASAAADELGTELQHARVDAERLRADAERLRADADFVQAEADRVRADTDYAQVKSATALERARAETARASAEADDAQRRLALLAEQAAAQLAALAEQQRENERAAEAIVRLERQLDELRAQAARELAEAQRDLAAAERAAGRTIAAAEQAIERERAQRAAAEAQFEERVAAHGAALEGLGISAAKAETAQRSLRDVRAELSAVRAELERARGELAATQYLCTDLTSSTSWRITKPFRIAMRGLRGR